MALAWSRLAWACDTHGWIYNVRCSPLAAIYRFTDFTDFTAAVSFNQNTFVAKRKVAAPRLRRGVPPPPQPPAALVLFSVSLSGGGGSAASVSASPSQWAACARYVKKGGYQKTSMKYLLSPINEIPLLTDHAGTVITASERALNIKCTSFTSFTEN